MHETALCLVTFNDLHSKSYYSWEQWCCWGLPCSSSLLHVNQTKAYKGEWGSISDNNVTAEGDHSTHLVQHQDYSTNTVQLSALILAQTHIQFMAGPRDLALHQNIHSGSTAHPVAYSVGTLNSFPIRQVARVCRTTHLPLQPRLTMCGAITPPIVHTVLACRQTALLVTSNKTSLCRQG